MVQLYDGKIKNVADIIILLSDNNYYQRAIDNFIVKMSSKAILFDFCKQFEYLKVNC